MQHLEDSDSQVSKSYVSFDLNSKRGEDIDINLPKIEEIKFEEVK